MFACLHVPRPSVSSSDILVRIAASFSPRFQLEAPDLIVLDVSGVRRMFGTPREVGEELRRAAADRGQAVRVAVAATRTAAVLAALGRAGLTVIDPGGEAAVLAPLQIRILERFAADDSGWRTRRSARADTNSRHYRMAPAPHSTPPPGFIPASPQVSVSAKRGPEGDAPRRRVAAPAPLALRISQIGMDGRPQAGKPDRASREARDARGGGAPRALNNADGVGHFARLPPEIFLTLRRWGLKTLGDVAALPRADLFERLGDAAPLLQRLAAGLDTAPLVPLVVEDPFEQSLELEWPIEGLEPLSFVLSRLLEPLCARLEREDCGAVGLHVTLRLVTREIHERSLQLPAPFRDPRVLRTLALLDLESHPPPAGIDRVTLAIDPAPGSIVQFSLIERALPAPEQLSTLLARLRALMGEERVGSPALVDTHQPGAFTMRAYAPVALRDHGAPQARSLKPDAPVPAVLRRIRQPFAIRVRVADGQPVYVAISRAGITGGSVSQAAGPWRTSGRWWERVATTPSATERNWSWNREEWDVALADGAIYRIFLDRDCDRWFLEAVAD